MKGMNTKLILNEPDDDKHNILKRYLHECCTKHGVPAAKKEQIIENGLGLFEIGGSGNYVFPRGEYQTIYEYVLAHRGEPDTVQDDDSELTKEQLYSGLIKAANSQQMKLYRQLRKQYFALV